jgi:CrcB protein
VTPPPITLRRAVLVAAGGMAGAVCRWAAVDTIGPDRLDGLPWALLAVNVLGSAVLAVAVVASRRRPDRASLLVDGVGTGFCGGLTTFSAFAVTTAEQLRGGEVLWATGSVLTMVLAGVAATACAEAWWTRIAAAGVEPS